MSTLVKICGITTPQDARACAEAGADRLGIIFAASSRQVTLAQAAIIARTVPDTPLVGVFRGSDPELVKAAIRAADLSVVQVHDCPEPSEWKRLADQCRRPILPALTVDQIGDGEGRHTLLLDLSKDPDLRTEAHRRLLFGAAARLSALGHPILVAGGLDSDNVADAIDLTACVGVDVCRGVEQSPGHKDPELVRRFIAAVHRVDRSPVDRPEKSAGENDAH
jgi:phosphoribosylanthranilate isomerase